MKLSEAHIRQLEDFLDRIRADTYPEPVTLMHTQITRRMVDEVRKVHAFPPRARILDVGCGQGIALELFTQLGYSPIGITINPVDLQVCRNRGFDVHEMDQSFLDFEENTFDLVWCRHCLEHSIFPFFTLYQVTRVLKPGGGLYVEVPAPDTSAAHQTNLNHYSTLVKSSWKSLRAYP